MNEKYLPIKIFEKRVGYDDRDTEGGGGDNIPKWVLTGEELKEHSQFLQGCISQIEQKYSKYIERKRLPMIISSRLRDEAIAKSYRGKIVNVLESDNNDNVIGFSGDRCILSMLSSVEVLRNVDDCIKDTNTESILISSIDDIEVFQPYICYDENEKIYKVKLINYNDFDLNAASKRMFEQFCANKDIKIVAKVRYTQELTVYKVSLDSVGELEAIEEFEGLYSAEPMEKIEVSLDGLEKDISIPLKRIKEDGDYPIVGILDTGIKAIEPLKEWLQQDRHLNYVEEDQDNSHGTFVAGIIEYGNELSGGQAISEGIKLFDAVVYPDTKKEKIYVCDLVDHIREAIERYGEKVKIWNLSLGTMEESEIDEFSDFGMALDDIQDENNVLIIKSAGNCTNFMKDIPYKSRISKSADSIRSIVVGAIAEKQDAGDEAAADMPSPFTRIGPGPGNIVKPDVVYYGGNAGIQDGKLIKHGVPSFGLDGNIVYDCGTSFSTPQVTRIVSNLNYLVDEEFDPLLIRALTIHSAQYPANNQLTMNDKVRQMGYGMPMEAKDILYNSPNEITLILRDTLEKGNFIEMFDFPFPKDLIDEKGYFRGQIILTMVNKAILDDKQAGEYCQSNIDIMLGTYEMEKSRDTSKRTVKNPKGLDNNRSILDDGLYSTRIKKACMGTGFEKECTLLKYGKKYHPVKKYAIDLKDMTPSNKDKYLLSDRKWYLKITGLYRDFIEKDAVKRNYQLGQEFCMILTIRDPEEKIPVYDQVTQHLTVNSFVHYNIQVRNDIHITSK